jgi:hypothetical protein
MKIIEVPTLIEWIGDNPVYKDLLKFINTVAIDANNIHKRKHGGTGTRLYNIWCGMKDRCYNPNAIPYSRYGGKGITICDEWVNDYDTFREWALTHGYKDTLTIDRINNNLGYSPVNCRWITKAEQNRNTSRTKLNRDTANKIKEMYATGKYTHTELSGIFEVHSTTIRDIIRGRIWK